MQAAQEQDLDPLLLLSLMRQESLFEGFIQSSAGANGLMQMIPTTAREAANNMGWPPVLSGSGHFPSLRQYHGWEVIIYGSRSIFRMGICMQADRIQQRDPSICPDLAGSFKW